MVGEIMHLAWWFVAVMIVVVFAWAVTTYISYWSSSAGLRREKRRRKELERTNPQLLAILDFRTLVMSFDTYNRADLCKVYKKLLDALEMLEHNMSTTERSEFSTQDVVDYIMPTIVKILRVFRTLDVDGVNKEIREKAINNLQLAIDLLTRKSESILASIDLDLDLSVDEDVLKWYAAFG